MDEPTGMQCEGCGEWVYDLNCPQCAAQIERDVNRPTWGGDVAPLASSFPSEGLIGLWINAAWRRELDAKLKAHGVKLEEIRLESW